MFSGRELKQEELVVGNLKSKVIVLEYSDLECPFCKKFHTDTMNDIYKKYDGKVGFAFRHFPLTFHSNVTFSTMLFNQIKFNNYTVVYKKINY